MKQIKLLLAVSLFSFMTNAHIFTYVHKNIGMGDVTYALRKDDGTGSIPVNAHDEYATKHCFALECGKNVTDKQKKAGIVRGTYSSDNQNLVCHDQTNSCMCDNNILRQHGMTCIEPEYISKTENDKASILPLTMVEDRSLISQPNA